jgi:DNA-binding IclR family transcriptional regulator
MLKPTVYRILATLESRGYLDREQGGGYRMSEKLGTDGVGEGEGCPVCR